MKTEGLSEVSALFDGELETHEVRAAIKTSLNESERWRLYGLIGDGLRGDCPEAPDLTAGVMSRLRDEPVVLAPRALGTRPHYHPLLALAASVAGVAIVGWLALTGNPQSPAVTEKVATHTPVAIASAVTPGLTFVSTPDLSAQPASRSAAHPPLQADMSEYLLAHHAHSPTSHLQDGTQQIRTVALTVARP